MSKKHHFETEAIVEKTIFKYRPIILSIFILITAFLAYKILDITVSTSYEKFIPLNHSYIQNWQANRDDMQGLGNFIRIAVETTQNDIFTKEYMDTLSKISNEVFFTTGVDKSKMESLWTPNVRWVEVTEEGFQGGVVIPQTYNGSPESLEQLRQNILRSGQVGRLVADNFKSTVIYAPLYEVDPTTNEKLNYKELSQHLENNIREKYGSKTIKIHIVGFAKIIGDIIEGGNDIRNFFIITIAITFILLLLYSHCIKSAILAILCSLTAVIWQLGLLVVFGYTLDPYSALVPFLIFAIAVSHSVQIINAMAIESLGNVGKVEAAKRTFRTLYLPGVLALVSDGIGFLTLLFIDIAVIKELAIAASIGVAVIIITNLFLLPILLSYLNVSKVAIKHAQKKKEKKSLLWSTLTYCSHPIIASLLILASIAAFIFSWQYAQNLKIGDLDEGAPELRPDSRYNLDNRFITSNYSSSADVFVVMVSTPPEGCILYPVLKKMDELQWRLNNLSSVQSSISLVNVSKRTISALNEGNLKWYGLSRNQFIINQSISQAPNILINNDCSLAPILVFLNDHRAETLEDVVNTAEEFANESNSDEAQFLLAAGNSGVEAATNQEIDKVQHRMLFFVYAVVSILCVITFRSIRAVICIIVPLGLTTMLSQALMTYLGIGVKVATLPVIALGVGIGVDYGIYIYSRLSRYLHQGLHLHEAYFKTLNSTGRAVSFTGFTLAIGVTTWIWSPIKFQADMGILLAFMFIWNMLGALCLLPALARFLIKPPKFSEKS